MPSENINSNIQQILEEYKKIAVVGISQKPHRDSHSVAAFMKEKGYEIFPVNPNYEKVLGLRCYNELKDIKGPIELVDIFRRSEHVEPIVEQAIEIGARAVWMQLGVINEKAAQMALDAGLEVVMDRCWKQEFTARQIG